jgi:hypothetical protein
MEARLRQLGVFCIVTSKCTELEEAMACVVELSPKQITEVTASPSGGSAQTTCACAIGDLNNKLALMAMLRLLPREEYADFVLSLMRQ